MAEQQAMGSIFTAIGVGALAGAVLLARRPLRLLRAGGRAQGTVVGAEEEWVSGKGPARKAYRPKVTFTTLNGRAVTFTSRTGGARRPEDGDRVTVVFDPANAEEAEVYGFAAMWLFPLVLALFGLPFLLIGIAVLIPD